MFWRRGKAPSRFTVSLWIILIIIRVPIELLIVTPCYLPAVFYLIWKRREKHENIRKTLPLVLFLLSTKKDKKNFFYPNVNRLQRGFLKLISPTPWYLSLQKLILVYLPETNYNILSWTKKYFAFQCSIKDFQKMPESFTCTVFFFWAKVQRNELWDGNLSQMTSPGNRQPFCIVCDCTACL